MKESHATLAGIAALLLWSTTIALARSVTEQLGPLTGGACIYILGGFFSTIVFTIRHKQLPFQVSFSKLYFSVCGGLFVFYMLALYCAIGLASDRMQLLEVGLINYLWPILTVVFSIPILRQSATRLIYLGSAAALGGIVLITTQRGDISIATILHNLFDNPMAYLCAFAAAISWGLYSNLSRKLGSQEPPGGVVLFMLLTGVCLMCLRFAFHESSNWNLYTLIEVFVMAVVSTAGYIFWDIGVRKGDFALVSTASYLTPLFSTVIACLYLQVSATPKLWIGCLLVIIGAYLSKRSLLNIEVGQR